MKKQKRNLYCTAPDGTVLKRMTNRDYTHVVLAKPLGKWEDFHWCSRLDLAQKRYREWAGRGYPVKVVEVDK